MNKFSIVVCAYNAANRLSATLDHLAKLEYPKDCVEIIVIDNNSNDGTSSLVRSLWKDLGNPFKLNLILEKKQGLSYARKRGIVASKYDFIIFCDDDNWLKNDYLIHANVLMKNHPDIGVLGGQGIPVTDAPGFPNWFYTYARCYATGVPALHSGEISSRGEIWGAAVIIRKKLILNIFENGYDFILRGREGEKLSSGEDTEMCKWYLMAGYVL